MAADAVLLPLVAALAFVTRYEGTALPAGVDTVLLAYVGLAVPLKLLAMWRSGLYGRLWRYASIADLEVLGIAVAAAGLVGAAVGLGVIPFAHFTLARVPLSVLLLDALLSAAAISLPRLLVRMRLSRHRRRTEHAAKRALIVGAGAAGSMIVREMLDNPQLHLAPMAFIDDDPSKRGRMLHGVPVVGSVAELPQAVARHGIQEIVVAMPTAPGRVVRDVVAASQAAGVPARTVPGMFELIAGRKSVSSLRKIEIEDLLRREPVRTDLLRVRALAAEKTVLVTGAGGSIGSELCRQIAGLDPALIVAVGRGENSIFELQSELRRIAPHARVRAVIADIRDETRMNQLFSETRPETVFHAAAHKHVPLMESNVAEAILNNVHGTRVVADAAWRYGARRFVLISSDKAVRPSSVMGATKRLAEGVVQRYSGDPHRHFVSVRFGNVLGSRGSVIPIFLRQVQAGGPVTITHREMRRFFMTIPEAVQLVLQAGILAEDGEVFVLDMGEPVRIYDLARDVIRLSGLEEGTDIEILETGIRPGEKLYEELFFDAEHAAPTRHPKVLRARNARLSLDDGTMDLDELIALARRNAPTAELRTAIRQLVPEYTGAEPETRLPVGVGHAASEVERVVELEHAREPKPVMRLAPSAP
jgi:FlaA1/EpsC-like NDP-sugar epimerase